MHEPSPLSLPSELPKSFEDSLALALILSAIAGAAEGEVSLRSIQIDLVRSSRERIVARLARLKNEGWIDRAAVDWVLGQGQIHDFGPRFEDEILPEQWLYFSEELLGQDGLLSPHLGKPQMARRTFGGAELILVELVRHNPGLWTKADLARLVTPLMVFDTAQQKAIDLHRKKKLLTYENKRLCVAQNVDQLINERSIEVGGLRLERILRSVLADRDGFYVKHGASLRRLWLKRAYKGQPCIRCGQPSGEIEHFPPKSWGGFDDWFTTFPVCHLCNESTRLFIQRFPLRQKDPTEVSRMLKSVPSGLSDLSWVIASNCLHFYDAVEAMNIPFAHALASESQILYRAFRDASRGEISREARVLIDQTADPQTLFEVPVNQNSAFLMSRPELEVRLTELALQTTAR